MLSIAPGYDPRYLTKAVGRGAENYYLSAVAEHGEPPGRWWGEGARELGLTPGSEVDGPTMERLYEEFLDPRDPRFLDKDVPDEDKARLGRKKQEFKSAKEILVAKLAAEPEASAERREELRIEAGRESRQAVVHHDATFSPTKSVTLLHAGLQAAAVQAEAEGRAEDAARFRQAAETVWDAVDAGAAAGLDYIRANAGDARYGYHGVDVEGRTTGKWMGAGNFVVARFRQHTNRDGEPQLHVHQAILNRQLCADWKWRGLDGKAVYRVRAAAGAVGERTMEEYLTRMLGVRWRARADGNGRELVGVSAEQIAQFSTRRVQVTAELEKRIQAYEAAHGHTPSARAIFKMAQDATKATKAAKPKSDRVPSRAEQLADWERRTTEAEIRSLSTIPGRVIGRFTGRVAERASQELAELDIDRVVTAAVADAQRETATFTRYELTRFINRHLPDYLGGLPAERVEAVLEELTDAALDPDGAGAARLLNAGDVVQIPQVLRRDDGRSVYQAPCAERYTTVDQLDVEQHLIASAYAGGAPALDPDTARLLVGAISEPDALDIEPTEADTAASTGTEPGAALDSEAAGREVEADPRESEAAPVADRSGPDSVRLRADQAAAAYGILTSDRRTDVLVGPAGTGKTVMVAQLATIWRAQYGTPVTGLSTSQNAAYVMAGEGLDDAWNITRWLQRVQKGEISIVPGQLIVVDEAAMVTTEHLARIQELAARHGAKIVWTGDPAQLAAPGAGGVMRHVVESTGAYELTVVARFTEGWEREASLRLRTGEVDALADYDHQGRLCGGGREEMETAAEQAYLADHLAGRQSLLLAPTNEQAAQLSARVRADLVDLGQVDEPGVGLHDGNTAARGDLIMARKNDHQVAVVDGRSGTVNFRELTNRDVLKVAQVNGDGSFVARLMDGEGRPGAQVEVPVDYVREHVELAYAGTVHAAQGRTVDTCHSLVDEQGTRQMLYVMLTRARTGNYAYVAVDRLREADLRPGPEQATEQTKRLRREAGTLDSEVEPLETEADERRRDELTVLLADIVGRDEASQTATEVMLAEERRPRHMAHLGSMWVDVIREYTAESYINAAEARGALTPSEAASIRSDEAAASLGRLLRQIEMSGRDAEGILDAAIAERELGSADSLAQVLHWRITQAGKERGIDVAHLDVDESQIAGDWSERTPGTGRDDIDGFLGEVAQTMTARQTELAEDVAHRAPQWLVEAIGPAPEEGHTADRAQWVERAGKILGYREQYAHASEVDPIGAAPSRANPEQRAAWWAAYDALGRPGTDRDVAGATLGQLWVMRAAYEREARWAPPHVAEELGRVTRDAQERGAEATRLRARAAAAADEPTSRALETRADAQQTLADAATDHRDRLREVHVARQDWHETTCDARLMAMRADGELRRRPDVDESRLPALHREFTEGREVDQREQQAEVHPGQLAFDVGALQRVPAAPVEHHQKHAGPHTAQVEHPDQLTLEPFAEHEHAHGERTAADLDDAVERARAAQRIIIGRAEQSTESPEVEAERHRREAVQRGPAPREEAQRAQEATGEARRRLEARERQRGGPRRPSVDPEGAEAARVAAQSFPHSPSERLRRSRDQQRRRPEQEQPPPQRTQHRGPEIGGPGR